MKTIDKIFSAIVKVLKLLSVALTIAFSLITLASVVSRYFLKAPFNWSEQTCRYLFIWSVMLYMPVIMREKGNLGFDLLVNKLPVNVQKILSIICKVLIDVFAVFYCSYTIRFIIKTFGKKFGGIKVPYWSVYSAQAVGAFLLALFTTEIIINDIIAMRKERKAK